MIQKINYADKQTGGKFSASDANEIKSTVNLNADVLSENSQSILSLQGGSLGSIKPTDAAPTPARNGNYTFSIGGNKPAWLTAEAGVTEVKAGDGVAVVYTKPSTYSYMHVKIDRIADIYNVTVEIPLAPDTYYDPISARLSIPSINIKNGLIITYQTASSTWKTEQFFGTKKFSDFNFELGSISSPASLPLVALNKIRTSNFIYLKKDDIITATNGCKFNLYYFDNNFTQFGTSVWRTGSYSVVSTGWFKIVAAFTDDRVIATADIPAVTASINSSNYIDTIGDASWKNIVVGVDMYSKEEVNARTVYNVTLNNPLASGYYISSQAKLAVPTSAKTQDTTIKYEVSNGIWVEEKFIGTDIAKWNYLSLWRIESISEPLRNLVLNGNFVSGLSVWDVASNTYTISSNIISVKSGAASVAITLRGGISEILPIGHKIYYKLLVKTSASNAVKFYANIYQNGGIVNTNKEIFAPVANQWYEMSRIILVPDSDNGNRGIIIQTIFSSTANATNQIMDVKYVSCIDLTEAYGEGNEPSIAELDALLLSYENNWFDGEIELKEPESIDTIISEKILLNKSNAALNQSAVENSEILDSLLRLEGSAGGERTIDVPAIESSVDNYILKLGLHYGDQIGDTLFDEIFFNKLCKNDFSDLRFEDENGNFLPFNIQSTGNYEIVRDSKVYAKNLPLLNGDIISSDATETGLYTSSDNNATRTLLFADSVLIFIDSNENIYAYKGYKVYRLSPADNYATPLVVLDLSSSGSSVNTNGMNEDSLGNIYIGKYQLAFDAELFKSVDGGLTFTSIYQSYDNQHVHTITVDKTVAPNTLYLGLDGINDGTHDPRCMKSIDYGATWSRLPIPFNNADFGVTYCGNGYRLCNGEADVLGGCTIYKTVDDVNFYSVLQTLQGVRNITAFDNVIIAGGNTEGANLVSQFYMSYDDGETWKTVYAANMYDAFGDGPRLFSKKFTPSGSAEPQMLVGGYFTGANSAYDPLNWRIFVGGDRHYALVYINIGSLPLTGRTIKVKYGYPIKYPKKQIYNDLSDNSNLILRLKLDEGSGSYIQDSVSGTNFKLPRLTSWINKKIVRFGIVYPFNHPILSDGINSSGGIKVSNNLILTTGGFSILFWANLFNAVGAYNSKKLIFGNINGIHIYYLMDWFYISDGVNAIRIANMSTYTHSDIYMPIAITVSDAALPVVKLCVGHYQYASYGLFTAFNPTLVDGKTMFAGWNLSDIYSYVNFPISDFRVFDKELTKAEIRNIYNGYEYFGAL